MNCNKYHYFILFCISALLCQSCSTVNVTGEWKSDKAPATGYDNIVVTALLSDKTTTRLLEDAIARELEERGVQARRGYRVYPEMYIDSIRPGKQDFDKKMMAGGTKAILNVSLLHVDTSVQYVPGSMSYTPYPRYDWYGNFWGYYSHYYPSVYDPGYYEVERTYFIEVNLFDRTDELVWSAQTETYNLRDITTFTDDFAKTVVDRLREQGLILGK